MNREQGPMWSEQLEEEFEPIGDAIDRSFFRESMRKIIHQARDRARRITKSPLSTTIIDHEGKEYEIDPHRVRRVVEDEKSGLLRVRIRQGLHDPKARWTTLIVTGAALLAAAEAIRIRHRHKS